MSNTSREPERRVLGLNQWLNRRPFTLPGVNHLPRDDRGDESYSIFIQMRDEQLGIDLPVELFLNRSDHERTQALSFPDPDLGYPLDHLDYPPTMPDERLHKILSMRDEEITTYPLTLQIIIGTVALVNGGFVAERPRTDAAPYARYLPTARFAILQEVRPVVRMARRTGSYRPMHRRSCR